MGVLDSLVFKTATGNGLSCVVVSNCQSKTAFRFKWSAGNYESGQRISLWRDSRVNVLTSEHSQESFGTDLEPPKNEAGP